MATKISTQAAKCLLKVKDFKSDNTRVETDIVFNKNVARLYLHNNHIATYYECGHLLVSNAGWFTKTTKERLNAIPNVNVFQKKGKWYLNGNEWDGQWAMIF